MKRKSKIMVIGGGGRLGSRLVNRMSNSRLARRFDIVALKRGDDPTLQLSGTAVIIITVKPTDLLDVADSLKGKLLPEQLLISLVTGKGGKLVSEWFGTETLVCATTNVGAEIGQARTVCRMPYQLSESHLDLAGQIFQNWGKVEWQRSDAAIGQAVINVGCMPAIISSDVLANAEAFVYELGVESKELAIDRIIDSMEAVVRLFRSGQSLDDIMEAVVTPNGVTDRILTSSQADIYGAKKAAMKTGYQWLLGFQ